MRTNEAGESISGWPRSSQMPQNRDASADAIGGGRDIGNPNGTQHLPDSQPLEMPTA